MVCLLSNMTHAQIYQYSDDGTKSCIDCEEKNSSTERSCLCIARFELGEFNRQIETSTEKDKWLYEQELLLATAITGINYFAQYNSPTGVSPDYNFQNIQRKYFKEVETNKLAGEYFTKVDNILKSIEKYDDAALQSSTVHAKLLDIRKREGTANPIYGDLKYNDKFLKDMTDAEVNTLLNEQLGIRNSQRSAATEYGIRNSRLERFLKEGYIANTLAGHLVVHYASLDYEDAIRFMTRYMVWVNNQKNQGIPHIIFGNPDNIFTLEDNETQYITNLTARTNGTHPPMDGYTHPVFNETPDDVALFNHAVNSFGANERNFLLGSAQSNIKKATKSYLENQRYNTNGLKLTQDLFKSYATNTPFPHNQYDYSLATGQLFSIDFQDAQNKNRLFHMENHNSGNSRQFNGLGNLLSSIAQLPERNEAFIGDFVIEVLKDNNHDMSTAFTGQQAYDLFHFRTYEYANLGRYPLGVDFNAFRGTILWDNDIRFPSFLEDPIEVDAILAHEANDLPQFEHLLRVRDLDKKIALSIDQINWLNDPNWRKESNKLMNFIESDGYTDENIKFVQQTILTFIDTSNIIPFVTDQNFPRAKAMKEIVRMNKWIKLFGSPELGGYIEAITPNLPSLSNAELYSLYDYTYKTQFKFKTQYYLIPLQVAEVFQPFVEYILLEVTGGIVIKLLEKLPAVIRSAEIGKIIFNLEKVSSLAAFKHAQKFGILSYEGLVSLFKTLKITRTDLGVQFHHLFEQRFVAQLTELLGSNTNKWKSIVLTVEEHNVITQSWRRIIGYNGQAVGTSGKVTSTATLADIKAAAREVYKDYPEILAALGL